MHDAPIGTVPKTPVLNWAQSRVAQGKFIAIHAGNMSRTTSVMPLLQAGKLLANRGRDDIAILLVGRGESEQELKEFARKQMLINVTFFPQIERHELAHLLRHCHAGVAALSPKPIYRFGYSLNKLFDYMLARLPVIFACNIPDGIVVRANAGLQITPDDPESFGRRTCRLADLDPAARGKLGHNG